MHIHIHTHMCSSHRLEDEDVIQVVKKHPAAAAAAHA
jgi:hypothetical protein